MRRPPARLVHGVLATLVLGTAALGVALLFTYSSIRATTAEYNALPRCAASAPTSAADCWSWRRATVTAVSVSYSQLGARLDLLSFQSPAVSGTVETEPTPAYFCAGRGDAVVLRFWKGGLTGVYTTHGFIPTPANPNVGHTDRVEAGLLLLSAAFVVPVSAAVARQRPSSRRASMGEFFADGGVLAALVLFGFGQFADVVTSVLGQHNGLLEGNALVADVIRAVGPLGFLLMRLPALVLVLVGVARLPRMLAIGVLGGAGVYFTGVAVHNLLLALAPAGPAACLTGPLL